jgi:aspartate aminotransferase
MSGQFGGDSFVAETKGINFELPAVVFSGIVAVRDRLLQLPNPLRLESGDPNFDTPEHIKEAAARAIRDNQTHYAPSTGIKPLREAIMRKVGRKNGITNINHPDQVLVTNGGMHGLYCAFRTILNPGDEVLIPQPNWTSTAWIIRIAGGVPVTVRLQRKHEYRWDIEELKSKITERTKAVLINSPQNPTGAVMTRQDLVDLLDVAREHDLFILADEAYEDIIFEGEHHSIAALALNYPRAVQDKIISCFTFSKSYAMTGWRLGYLTCTNAEFNENARKMILYTINGVSTPTQYAGVAALEGPQEAVGKMAAEYKHRRDLLFDAVNGTEYMRCDMKPKGAVYLYARITENWQGTEWDLVNHLIERYSLGSVPGEEFADDERSIRFAYACSTEMILQTIAALKK